MSNPDSSTPSIQALDLAVKPAGYPDWNSYVDAGFGPRDITYRIALAYAHDLDKADKQNREVLRLLSLCQDDAAEAILRANLLPDPIDPDLLEVEKIAGARANSPLFIPIEETILAALKRGRELAKEQDRG